MTELGYQTRLEAEVRLVESLNSRLSDWPRETFRGFMVHFTNRNLQALSEFSTIDTTILVLGAPFAGNYFGGEVEDLALQLKDGTQWSDAIKSENNPRIYSVVNPETGAMGGNIRPFNEYFLVAYLANLTSPAGSKANLYFETYMSSSGQPAGDGTYPVHKNYQGYDLLTDQAGIFMSSFIPQFCYSLAKGYQNNQYHTDMNT